MDGSLSRAVLAAQREKLCKSSSERCNCTFSDSDDGGLVGFGRGRLREQNAAHLGSGLHALHEHAIKERRDALHVVRLA